MYQIVLDQFGNINANIILRLSDKTFIPNDAHNIDWQDYQTWVAQGGTPSQLS